jgi:integrase
MGNTLTTLRFEQRTARTNNKGEAPLRIVYQLKGQRKFYPTTLKCQPVNWNSKEQQAVFINRKTAKRLAPDTNYELLFTAKEVEKFNSDLNKLVKDIRDIEERFRLDSITYTPTMVMQKLAALKVPLARTDEPKENVVDFIRQLIRDLKGERKPGTLKVYYGLGEHLAAFERKTGKRATFQAMDIPLLRSFHGYLCTDRSGVRKGKPVEIKAMNNITAAKQLSTLKTLLNYARVDYHIPVNPAYRDYKISRKDSDFEVITLSEEEFLLLYNYDLSGNKKLDQVRDVFCFSCATGLRYSDLAQLQWEHIRNNTVKMTAAKTGQKLSIPLNQYSSAILEKYKGRHRPLPVISNQKTNDFIKELGQLAEIDTPVEIVREYGNRRVATLYKKYELLSAHVGRKTFTTLSLEKGIAPQDVMSLTGHSTFKAFKRYVDVSEKQKKAVMAKAWGEVKDTNLKVV